MNGCVKICLENLNKILKKVEASSLNKYQLINNFIEEIKGRGDKDTILFGFRIREYIFVG